MGRGRFALHCPPLAASAGATSSQKKSGGRTDLVFLLGFLIGPAAPAAGSLYCTTAMAVSAISPDRAIIKNTPDVSGAV